MVSGFTKYYSTSLKKAKPFKILGQSLRSDPLALKTLWACLFAVLSAALVPPILTLNTPAIHMGLRIGDSDIPSVLTKLYFFTAVLVLLGGISGDLFGRKKFLLIALALFNLSLILNIVWANDKRFLLADLLNGLSAISILPLAVAIATVRFNPLLRYMAYSILYLVNSVATLGSSILYDFLNNLTDPRLTFLPALILGLIALWYSLRHISESHAPAATSRLSAWFNILWIISFFILLFSMLSPGNRFSPISQSVIFAISVLAVLISIKVLSRQVEKISSIRFYSIQDLFLAILASVMFSFAQGTLMFQLITFFSQVQDEAAKGIILRLIPFVIGMLGATVWMVHLSIRREARYIITVGMGISAAGLLGFIVLHPQIPYLALLAPLVIFGVGAGIASPARTAVVLGAAPAGLIGTAAAITSAANLAGYGLGVISSSLMISRIASFFYVRNLKELGFTTEQTAYALTVLQDTILRLGTREFLQTTDSTVKMLAQQYEKAFSTGIGISFAINAGMLFILIVPIWLGMSKGLKSRAEMLNLGEHS